MCIIVYKPAGKQVSEETLRHCYSGNRDGCGLMWAEGGKLHVAKGLMSFEEFYKIYKRHEKHPMACHFRIRTLGDISKENCHPFKVNNTLAFMHNGGITIQPSSKEQSDTFAFNEQILKKLPKNFLETKGVIMMIEKFIGGSKLVFMDNEGNTTIVREKAGVWDDGVWYSHSGYKPYSYATTRHTSHYSGTTTPLSELDSKIFFDKGEASFCLCCMRRLDSEASRRLGICYSCERAGVLVCPSCFSSIDYKHFHIGICKTCQSPLDLHKTVNKREIPSRV